MAAGFTQAQRPILLFDSQHHIEQHLVSWLQRNVMVLHTGLGVVGLGIKTTG